MKSQIRTMVMILAALAMLVPVGSALAQKAIYDFEGLSTSLPLVGQDGWTTDLLHDATIGAGNGFGPSQGATLNGPLTGGVGNIGRVNDINWSYSVDFSSPSYQYSIDRQQGSGSAYTTFGYDANNDGKMSWGSPDIYPGSLYMADSNVQISGIQGGAGGWMTSTAYPSIPAGDWVRVMFEFNWTENGFGPGTVSAFVKDLTAVGENGTYSAIPGLQHLYLNTDWAPWRAAMISDSSKAGLFLMADSTTGPTVDNLAFGIPEPSTAALLVLGGLTLLRHRRIGFAVA